MNTTNGRHAVHHPRGFDGASTSERAPAILVAGTGSGVGKSLIVTALCRVLARRGIHVAPFKAQNMSNNSAVADDGGELGRAQFAQALAAGVGPETAMNPVLLKPTGERTCQVVVRGRVAGTSSATGWQSWSEELRPVVLDALDDLRRRFDVVVLEGAGGAAEINLLDRDVVNLPLADRARIPVVVVADIDRGGAFAALYGTWALLPAPLRARIRGFVINRFRGDPTLLEPAIRDLEARTGIPTLAVLPWLDDVGLDEEDSQFLVASPEPDAALDVAAIRLPHAANTSDLDPLALEPGVRVRWVDRPAGLGTPDLVVVPGTKATVEDLAWFRRVGLAAAVESSAATVLGICGGYQLLGEEIVDDVESGTGLVPGLGWLPVTTRFRPVKLARRRRGSVGEHAIDGYEIRHGRVERGAARPWIQLDDEHGTEAEGCLALEGRVLGTSLHGVLEADAFRRDFLAEVARRHGRELQRSDHEFAAARSSRFDVLADWLEYHLDVDAVLGLAVDAVATVP